MDYKIAVLKGDGIGPEIVDQAIKVMKAIGQKFGHNFNFTEALTGATAIDKVGDPYPEETHQLCMDSDAVLFGAIGDPKYDNDPKAKIRPEQGLLAMRKKLGLYARTSSSIAPYAEMMRDPVPWTFSMTRPSLAKNVFAPLHFVSTLSEGDEAM